MHAIEMRNGIEINIMQLSVNWNELGNGINKLWICNKMW